MRKYFVLGLLAVSLIVGYYFYHRSLGFSVVTRYKTTLASPMTSSQTTIPASSVTSFDGHTLTMVDLGSSVYLTVEPGASKEEIIKCTGISGTSWTGCTRGLAFYGTSEISVSTNQKTHNAGSTVVMSNVHYIYEQLVDKDSTQNVTSTLTFFNYPLVDSSLGNATTSRQLLTLGQAQTLASQGGATSTESVAGISELATQLEMASSTYNGVDSPLVLQSRYATSSPYTTGLWLPVTQNNGKLSQLFLDLTQSYTWTGLHTFSGGLRVLGGVNVSSTNATSNILLDSFSITSSTVTSTIANGLSITNGLNVGSLCFDGINCGTDITSLVDTVTTTAFGGLVSTSSVRNNVDTQVITTGFAPKFVKLNYTISGYGDVGVTNKYFGQKGIAIWNKNAVLVSNNIIWGGGTITCPLTGDSGTPASLTCFPFSSDSANLEVGEHGQDTESSVTIAVSNVSATGFTATCTFVTQSGPDNNSQCQYTWEAYR